jgi:hypothetical protein
LIYPRRSSVGERPIDVLVPRRHQCASRLVAALELLASSRQQLGGIGPVASADCPVESRSARAPAGNTIFMATKKPQFSLRGRSAKTGRFISLKKANRNKATSVVERIPLPRRRKAK